jgi:hypothetical protein
LVEARYLIRRASVDCVASLPLTPLYRNEMFHQWVGVSLDCGTGEIAQQRHLVVAQLAAKQTKPLQRQDA